MRIWDFQGNAKWGAGPKVALGVIFGYFLGKFSYQSQCAEKIMQLPNSKLAEMLKMKKRGGLMEKYGSIFKLKHNLQYFFHLTSLA